MVGTQRAMRVAVSKEGEKLDSNLSFLATVGSITSYRLIRPVWGIMNFSGVIKRHNWLAAVAPGIRSLSGNRHGLFAAIPAVVVLINSYFSRWAPLTSYENFRRIYLFASTIHY